MSTVYLNGQYLPMHEAKISPMDRGFLFGDGIYEVIPSYNGKPVGLAPHIERMGRGLKEIGIALDMDLAQWREVVSQLISLNGDGNLGVYLHVSRGADTKRFHAYPANVKPTLFAFAFEIPPAPKAERASVKALAVTTSEDLRWKRCHIKSTSLLGNVMHFQQGQDAGVNETILYNSQGEVTEASACNVFIVKNDTVITPPLDNQILPGITRQMLLHILKNDGAINVEERIISLHELRSADEIWLTSSSKEIAPVTVLDDKPVGSGKVGDIWPLAQALFSKHKYNY